MREFPFGSASPLYLEIGSGVLHALRGDNACELPLERQRDGRLTGACKARVDAALRKLLGPVPALGRVRVWCAIGARGVSLRRLSLPGSSPNDLQRVLRLQIESEFPLPPDELAWGFQVLGATEATASSGPRQDVLVAAVKKESIEDYAESLAACGAEAVFTLAAVARRGLASQPPGNCVVLEVGPSQSELACFENGAPSLLRVLSAGFTPAARPDEEESGAAAPPPGDDLASRAAGAILELSSLSPQGARAVQRVYLTGEGARQPGLAASLSQRLGTGAQCEPLGPAAGPGRSAAILGLRRVVEAEPEPDLLVLQIPGARRPAQVARLSPRKWAALAVLLAAAVLAFPWAEAAMLKARLTRRLTAIRADKQRLATIDRELSFLQFLRENQPPYLETVFLLAKSAAPGMRLESVSMDRRGEISVKGSLRDGNAVADFRTKLIDSGFFSSVAVEEQTPTPDRQKVNVRITAQWKPGADWESLAVGAAATEPSKPKAAGTNAAPAGVPGAAPPTAGTLTNPPTVAAGASRTSVRRTNLTE